MALHHVTYAARNLFNLQQAYGAVKAVFGQAEAPFYPRSMMPPVRSPLLLWAAVIDCGIALLLWFGLFLTIGATLFQMWQTPLGQGAMGNAFRNGMFAGLVMLILLFLPTV
ncbi:MAG TPA: DUF2165 family protein [Wenzhouxiangellaceae bacterium]|nr:DUF2165 family protein [Wenzhouxiangellaceae bacterium]